MTTDLPQTLVQVLFQDSVLPQDFQLAQFRTTTFCTDIPPEDYFEFTRLINNWPKQQQHLHIYMGDLHWVHGNPLHTFMTEGLGWSRQALPAGFFVPYHTHCRMRYLMPCVSQGAAHCTCTQACMLKTNKCLC